MVAPVAEGTGWVGLFTFDLAAGTDAMPAVVRFINTIA